MFKNKLFTSIVRQSKVVKPKPKLNIVTSIVPVRMLIFCPECGTQHIDVSKPGWDNPPHKSHLCINCNTIWRPADIYTEGVLQIKTRGTNDTWPHID